MKRKPCIQLIVYLTLNSVFSLVYGQGKYHEEAFKSLSERGEVIFAFNKADLGTAFLSRMISIDRIDGDIITAYANFTEFNKFLGLDISYSLVEPAGSKLPFKSLDPDQAFYTEWDSYPSYEEYLEYLSGMVTAYPEICSSDTIGLSEEGRIILALKISDHVQIDEAEPEFFYTSTMHGDEVTGMMLTLRLIDHLLSNYGTDPEITCLVDSIEIYINPNANPDGTYAGGNSSVAGATRYNSNSIDLNRNFPDPQFGDHPDGNAWQKETKAMMAYHEKRKFALSANYHGGAEVMNYPWDTWAKAHPDANWFEYICYQYADTVKSLAGQNYFSDVIQTGVINGYDWYPVAGGRQDYLTYFHHGREVTIEVSSKKIPPAAEMNSYWEWNKSAMLTYLKHCTYGIHGQVRDLHTGEALMATISLVDFDKDNSFVMSDSLTGEFHRLLEPGEYTLVVTKEGYLNKILPNIVLSDYESSLYLDIQLEEGVETLNLNRDRRESISWINEARRLEVETTYFTTGRIVVYNDIGQLVHDTGKIFLEEGTTGITLSADLKSGIYFASFQAQGKLQDYIQFSLLK